MLRVMLVDDEPFILQGLQILIDWNAEGCEIVALKNNGKEALDYLKENQVDLIISDIQMPVMTGLELLETINRDSLTDAHFVILTGYDDFLYAQKAIKNNCYDYILKPVQKDDILKLVRDVAEKHQIMAEGSEKQKKLEDAYLAGNIISLIKGKFDDDVVEYVEKHLQVGGYVRYVDIEIVDESSDNEEDDYDLRIAHKNLLDTCKEVLKENANHFVFDVSYDENNYDVGFVYCENMATRNDMNDMEFMERFSEKLEKYLLKPVMILCGKCVPDISSLAKSYSSCCMLNSIKGFHKEKSIYIYEDEVQIGKNNTFLCKKTIDECILAIESNDKNVIEAVVEKLFAEMHQQDESGSMVNLNINYLLFQLIHIATQQDDDVNQEEVIKFISENSFEQSFTRGSIEHMKNFAIQYSDYLVNLRKKVSHGILYDIEMDIKENYADNITLRSLGEKYYMNSSYLGQVFRKKYSISFKDYLTKIRIDEAVKLLINTDKKINQIAEEVGYLDCDYFIRKFIEIKGCTPSKFRKNNSNF